MTPTEVVRANGYDMTPAGMYARFYADSLYRVDEHGIIRDLGGMYGQAWFAPLIREVTLNGCGELLYSSDHGGDCVELVELTDADRHVFGLEETDVAATVTNDDQGFIYVVIHDAAGLERVHAEVEVMYAAEELEG